jgi:hypothetical protein
MRKLRTRQAMLIVAGTFVLAGAAQAESQPLPYLHRCKFTP